MARRTALLLVLALAAARAASAEEGVAAVEAAWTKALLAGDAAAAASLYTPRAIIYPPDNMELKGLAAIRRGYEDFLGRMKVLDVKLTAEGSETVGDTSVAWGHWTMKMAPKAGGNSIRSEGRYMAVARKVGVRWLYEVSHASVPQPPK